MQGTTAFLGLPKPHEQHDLAEDLVRLQTAFDMLDGHAEVTAARGDQVDLALASVIAEVKALDEKQPPQASEVLTGITRHGTLDEHLAASGSVAATPKNVRAMIEVIAPSKADLEGLAGECRAMVGAVPGVLSGLVFPFSGSLGGPDDKHPIDRGTGEPDLSYALCDGGTYIAPDGAAITAPDLRDRFVLGAGGTRAAEATGGAESHGHTGSAQAAATGGTVGNTTLSGAQMPSHGHSLMVSGGSGMHNYETKLSGLSTNQDRYGGYLGVISGSGSSGAHTHAFTGGSHSHGVTVSTATAMPPFFALCYVMKL